MALFGLALVLSGADLPAGAPDQLCLSAASGIAQPMCVAGAVRMLPLRLEGEPRLCTLGSQVQVDLEVRLVSSTDLWDIGIWIHQYGGSARSDPGPGCYRTALVPIAPTASSCDHTGLLSYYNGDDDACGDLYSSSQDPCMNRVLVDCVSGEIDEAGLCLLTRRLVSLEVACVDADLDTIVDAGACTSWDNSTLAACSTPLDAVPTSGSRCDCDEHLPIEGLVPALFFDGFESEGTGAWSATVL